MDKLEMKTKDLTQENVEKIGELFPTCVTETVGDDGKIRLAVDFEALKRQLTGDVIPQDRERYLITWPGKSDAQSLAFTPTTCTLRPDRSSSINFNETKNIYVEGDNLEVLKLLRENYQRTVKMIYIDPPYNTGNDFLYNDNFQMSEEDYSKSSGEYDEYGQRMIINTNSRGRYHTDWLNMIYPRLVLARDFLSDDGVIFISIDDNEEANLTKICNEIFGERNKIGTIIWERAFSPKNDAKFISSSHDYILAYARNINSFKIGKLPRTEEANARYKNPDNDPRGPWTPDNLTVKTYSSSYDYPIETPGGRIVNPSNGSCWRVSKDRFKELVNDNRIYFGNDGNNVPRLKRFLSEVQDGMVPTSIWKCEDVGHNQEGRQELKKLFSGKGYFDGPKPTRLMMRLMEIANLDDDSIVMDFFSGSATTADSLMKINHASKKHCKFILIQLPEKCDEKSQAYLDGYKTICDIGRKRIELAGMDLKKKIDAQDLDIGFRVFKLDSSNMNDVYYDPRATKKDILDYATDNIKSDRTPEDLLIQVMLEFGCSLSDDISIEEISGKTVFAINTNYLIACFDENINDDVVTEIAKRRPLNAAFRDSSMSSDDVAINFYEIFKTYSPDTKTKVL